MNLILQIDSHADLCLNLHTFIYGFDKVIWIALISATENADCLTCGTC